MNENHLLNAVLEATHEAIIVVGRSWAGKKRSL